MPQNKNKWLIAAVIAVIVLGAGWYFWATRVEVTTYAKATAIDGDYSVAAKQRTVLEKGASLTVKGDLTIDGGEFVCDSGALLIAIEGDLIVKDGTLRCMGEDSNIGIVVVGSISIDKDSQIISEGPIQIVSKLDKLAVTREALDKLYQDAATPTGKNRIGPFLGSEGPTPAAGAAASVSESVEQTSLFYYAYADASNGKPAAKVVAAESSRFGIAVAQAQGGTAVINIAGRIVIPTPPKNNKRPIIVFNFPGVDGVRIQNLDLQGPDGLEGDGDVNKSCTARGKDGGDAMRFLAYAGSLTVNDFTLTLGSGGNGGSAATKADCYPQATATGGRGGASGNFKMVGEKGFEITGAFSIMPGRGGNGGNATANAKSGGPSEKGGDATANGGAGADNIKSLGMTGTVAGVANVQVGSMIGGAGGNATANGGNGGNGEGCGKKGGDGGKATATAGKGGDARVNLVGGAVRTPGANDTGGDGGDASSKPGAAGNGGSCDPTGPGGAGGKGGDAKATVGKGGKATQNGADGAVQNETGGNGGNGGDGCKAGKGGKGGNGNPKGTDGKDGKDNCVGPGQSGAGVVPGGGTGTGANVEVEVIRYGGKYIPVSQLMIEEHSGCDNAAHWHSKPAPGGPVKATDGSTMRDPGPDCGFGKVSNVPKMKITVPAAQVQVNFRL